MTLFLVIWLIISSIAYSKVINNYAHPDKFIFYILGEPVFGYYFNHSQASCSTKQTDTKVLFNLNILNKYTANNIIYKLMKHNKKLKNKTTVIIIRDKIFF